MYFFNSGKIAKAWSTLRKKSYVEIISDEFIPGRGWKLKLDWNKYFIADVTNAGIDGDSEEEIAYNWLNSLIQQSRMEEHEEELLQRAEKGYDNFD